MERYAIRRRDGARYESVGGLAPGAIGMTRWHAIGNSAGAVHTDFGVTRLDPGSHVPSHQHSFEEIVFVLEGEVILDMSGRSLHLVRGDYGIIPVNAAHAWHSVGEGPAAWADLLISQPRAIYGYDTRKTFEVPESAPIRVGDQSSGTAGFGHWEMRSDADGVADSGADSPAGIPGTAFTDEVHLDMMVDAQLGAHLGTTFMVHYGPEAAVLPHDHPFEETYLILEGEVRATFDGEDFTLSSGDVAWAGVGCVHSFTATGEAVRWLETQSPQPPREYAFRAA